MISVGSTGGRSIGMPISTGSHVFSSCPRLKTRGERNLSLNEILRDARITWHGVKLNQPDWSDDSHSLALTADTLDGRFLFHGIINAYWEPLAFELPPCEGNAHQGWRRAIDTALESPNDINQSPDEAPVVPDGTYLVQPRSMVVVFALRTDGVKEGVGS